MPELTEAQKRKRDEIAEKLKADPNFAPQEGRTKEESAFAVATEEAKANPGNPGNETVLQELRIFADDMAMTDPFRAKGAMMRLAISRGDWKRVHKIVKDMAKEAKEGGEEEEAEYLSYLADSMEGV